MPRSSRKKSSTGIYHVMARGSSKQLIFEDDVDRARFMDLLAAHVKRAELEVLAYCLMGNHVHLLFSDPEDNMSSAMKGLLASYATWFNLRHGRCGHLFQGRFRSEPVEGDEYLLTVVRYIHENPAAAGLAEAKDWKWSSFREYTGIPSVVSTDLVLDILGGKSGFVSFHEKEGVGSVALDVGEARIRMADEEALALANELLGDGRVQKLRGADRRTRDEALRLLKENGLGVRQIQRLSGISLGSISKA